MALTCTILANWEAVALSEYIDNSAHDGKLMNLSLKWLSTGLVDGGCVFFVYSILLATAGTMALTLSLAKMVSICPIAGAQYH